MKTVMAALAFLVLCAFLGILLWYVPRLDLGLVIGATLLLTAYDLFVHERRGG
jgi:hypothetical protein